MTARYALYFAPDPESPWGRFGAAWLGHSAAKEIVEARRYGFHATLKAPFRLAGGASLSELLDELDRFCAARSAFQLPRLEVSPLDDFLALVPTTAEPRLDAIAAACVRGFDRFRAPPGESEIARRRRPGLNARQEGNLARWGYPHVLECFRFHLSLTGRLLGASDAAIEALRCEARARVAALGDPPLAFDSICVSEERRPGADFALIHRSPLARAGRLIYLAGPSGAGKDSLLEWVRARLPADSRVRFARRTITRPASAGGEQHNAATETQFDAALARGDFALHWRANGHRYGIGREIEDWLAAGQTVVVSGSREHLPPARSRFPQLEAVQVTASTGTLRSRLVRRGREKPQEAFCRLARNEALSDSVRTASLLLANNGPIEVAGSRLLEFLANGS